MIWNSFFHLTDVYLCPYETHIVTSNYNSTHQRLARRKRNFDFFLNYQPLNLFSDLVSLPTNSCLAAALTISSHWSLASTVWIDDFISTNQMLFCKTDLARVVSVIWNYRYRLHLRVIQRLYNLSSSNPEWEWMGLNERLYHDRVCKPGLSWVNCSMGSSFLKGYVNFKLTPI